LLEDATAAFIDAVPERAFDEPLMAMLRAEGFEEVRLTHGQTEFGKDIVAKRDGKQWAFQSKAGNIGQPEWRNLEGQLNELRRSNYSGPEFDPDLPREPVLVLTGRLAGNAPLSANEYNRQAKERGEPELTIWNRDELLSRLSGNPDAVLRGTVDGGMLSMLGSVAEGGATMDSVEQFSRRWDSFPPGELSSRGVIEASVVCAGLQRATRLDLACHLSLCLVRAAWANDQAGEEAFVVAEAGGELFDAYARELWASCDDDLLRKRGVVSRFASGGWASYPVFCSRLAEILGLLGVRAALREDADSEAEIADWLARFVYSQPGVAHPLSDRFAVSMVPSVLLLQKHKPRAAKKLLEKTTVWLSDRYERGGDGLAGWGIPPIDETERVFGGAFEHVRRRGRRTQSHVASLSLDLAAICGYRNLYGDIRNDHLAARLVPVVLRCPDGPDQYVLTGEANRWELNPEYPDALPRDRRLDIPHHREACNPRRLVRDGRSWDLLAVSAALRDRHFLDAISSVYDAISSSADPLAR
jgi:Restriction endonuclease